jgi:hypothetical protein
MNSKNTFCQFLLIGLFGLSCVAGTKGAKKMETECWQMKPVEIEFKESIITMFPVTQLASIGMVAGNIDHETLRIVKIHNNKLSENVFPAKEFEPYDNIGYCFNDCSEMYLHQSKILTFVNWQQKIKTISYKPLGNMVENEFAKSKVINFANKIILTVFSPIYDESYKNILNNTYLFTLEDLVNKKRIKSIPISIESGSYITDKRSDISIKPTVAFGPDYVIYRESNGYNWLCINNSLDSIDHPLKDTLNNYKEYFESDYVSLEISPTQPYAVAICQKIHKKYTPAIIQWNKAPAIMPVSIPLEKEQNIEPASLQLSPSGRWAYFYTTGYPGGKHFLLYIDTLLPGGCLPQFDLKVESEDNKATWMTNPEGLVMKVGGKLMYWDLSKFNANDFLKTQESEFLKNK